MKINTVILVLLSSMIGVIIGFFAIMTIEEKNNNEARWSHPELIELLESKELKFSLKTVPGIKTDMKLIFENGEMLVRIKESAQEAKDRAGSRGKRALAWDRFYFYSDNSELILQMNELLSKTGKAPVYLFNRDTFQGVQKKNTKRDVDVSKLVELSKVGTGFNGSGNLFQPRIAMKWENISGASIKESIDVEVVFIDNSKNEELSRSSKHLHLSWDAPMKPNVSKQFYLTCSVGWAALQGEKNIIGEIYVNKVLYKKVKIRNRVVELWRL